MTGISKKEVMGKLDIKKIYEGVEEQRKYGLLCEDGEEDSTAKDEGSKEGSEDEKKEDAEPKADEKVTVDSLVKDMMKLEPSQLLKFIAKQEDKDAKAWLLANLLPFAAYVVKNGYVKAKALAGSVKDIGKKSKEDDTGIDYDNVEIDESSIKTKFAFDEETVKKLKEFIAQYKKEMENGSKDIEKAAGDLDKDIKKAGVKIEPEKLADNTLTVAGVVDDKANKGKSGKEMTELVNQQIEIAKQMKELQKKADELAKMAREVKVDPKYAKMSVEELEKLTKDDEKKKDDASKKTKDANESIVTLAGAGLLTEATKLKDLVSKDAVAAIVKAAEDGGKVKAGDHYVRKSGDMLVRHVLKQSFPAEYEALDDMRSNARKAAISRLGMIAHAAAKGDSKTLKDTLTAAGLGSYADDVLGKAGDAADALKGAVSLDDFASKADKLAEMDRKEMMAALAAFKPKSPDEAFELAAKLSEAGADDNDINDALQNAVEKMDWYSDADTDAQEKFRDLLSQTALHPEDLKEVKGMVDDEFDVAVEKAASAASNAKEAASSGAKLIGNGLVDGKGHAFSPSGMLQKVGRFDDYFDDGKLDPSEYKEMMKFQDSLIDYQTWAAENAGSDDPNVQAKIAQIALITKKFNGVMADNDKLIKNAEAGMERIGELNGADEAAKQGAKQLADNEETKEVAQGFLGKLGKALRVFGQAKMVAKIGKFVLNDGKAAVDAIGGQYVKFKEDQNAVAEMTFILMNADDSSAEHSDTKFSLRFDTSDMKWHITNLDDRKKKIEKEDVLLKKVLDDKECKEWRADVLKQWEEVLRPKDEASKFIPYFIKNYEKLGVKLSDKGMKKYFETLAKLADKFDEVKKQFA